MVLSHERSKLEYMSAPALQEAILERRKVIREHRDAKGDDRCWLDDYLVHAMMETCSPSERFDPRRLEETLALAVCGNFYHTRRADESDPVPDNAILDPEKWDTDLSSATHSELVDKLLELQQAIYNHQMCGLTRTIEHDRKLYTVLPEKIPADFRLPSEEEFLGEAKAPNAGCPSFWRSHAGCNPRSCDLHKWGPCQKIEERA